jgi:hypothetical protein
VLDDLLWVVATDALHEFDDYLGQQHIIFAQLFNLFYQSMPQLLLLLPNFIIDILLLSQILQLLFEGLLKTRIHRFSLLCFPYVSEFIIVEQLVANNGFMRLWFLKNGWGFSCVLLFVLSFHHIQIWNNSYFIRWLNTKATRSDMQERSLDQWHRIPLPRLSCLKTRHSLLNSMEKLRRWKYHY